jgi:hypothetical protein
MSDLSSVISSANKRRLAAIPYSEVARHDR